MNKSGNSSRKKVTPRSLVRKQVENKDFHVSEEDMSNLDMSLEDNDNKLTESANLSDINGDNKAGTPYDILGK